MFVLIFGCAREWLENTFNLEIKTMNNQSCKIILYLCYVASSFSAWIHVFIAIERWLAIIKPLKIKIICTSKINRIINISLLFLCLIINSPLLWFSELDEKLISSTDNSLGISVTKICEVRHDDLFVNALIIFTDSIFYCLLPFVVIFIFSSIAIYKLIHAKTARSLNVRSSTSSIRSYSSTRSGSSKNYCQTAERVNFITNRPATVAICREIKESTQKTNLIWYYKNSGKALRKSRSKSLQKNTKQKSQLKSTIMLLSLPVCYMTTELPIIILIFIGWIDRQYYSYDETSKDETSHYFMIAHLIASILVYINSSINILFYILFGKYFRQDFLAIIPCVYLTKFKFIKCTRKQDKDNSQ